MITFHQLAVKYRNFVYIKKGLLHFKPQQLAVCMRTVIRSPRKPNSAKRRVVQVWFKRLRPERTRLKVYLFKVFKVYSYLPGIGSKVIANATVLLRGGRVKDLPGIKFHLICGVYDLKCVASRKKARSKYGTKRFIS